MLQSTLERPRVPTHLNSPSKIFAFCFRAILARAKARINSQSVYDLKIDVFCAITENLKNFLMLMSECVTQYIISFLALLGQSGEFKRHRPSAPVRPQAATLIPKVCLSRIDLYHSFITYCRSSAKMMHSPAPRQLPYAPTPHSYMPSSALHATISLDEVCQTSIFPTKSKSKSI